MAKTRTPQAAKDAAASTEDVKTAAVQEDVVEAPEVPAAPATEEVASEAVTQEPLPAEPELQSQPPEAVAEVAPEATPEPIVETAPAPAAQPVVLSTEIIPEHYEQTFDLEEYARFRRLNPAQKGLIEYVAKSYPRTIGEWDAIKKANLGG